jgi:hypothetical protein
MAGETRAALHGLPHLKVMISISEEYAASRPWLAWYSRVSGDVQNMSNMSIGVATADSRIGGE